jgi:hypothetical protein
LIRLAPIALVVIAVCSSTLSPVSHTTQEHATTTTPAATQSVTTTACTAPASTQRASRCAPFATIGAPAVANPSWTRVYSGAYIVNDLWVATLTTDGVNTQSVQKPNATVQVSAPPVNGGGNLRQVFWPGSQGGASMNQRSCATWSADSQENRTPVQQQGLAVRIASANGRTRALTVTRNVWADVGWVFNAHTWDTDLSSTEPFVGIAQWDMAAAVAPAGYAPFPWRTCLQVLDNVLLFKIWVPAAGAEPSWNDPVHVRTALLPQEFVYPGRAGWYAGHLVPGGSFQYSDLEIHRYSCC